MSEEKYGITDAHYLCDSAIFNTETNEIFRLYQICEMLNQQDTKISDLEAKLAEKEKEIGELKRIGEKGHLKDLLEDKRKENKILVKAIEQANLSKTEFAIQQLQRVKEKFGYKFNSQLMVSSKQMVDFVDQIINELKGESCGYK